MKIPGGKKKKATSLLYIDGGSSDPSDEAYYHKAMKLIEAHPYIGVYTIRVRHDDECAKLKGGTCRCDADVTMEPYPPARST